MFSPLQEDIGKALEAYAKSHNIHVIIDGSQVPLVYAADALDITGLSSTSSIPRIRPRLRQLRRQSNSSWRLLDRNAAMR